jgi:hypothetical protein
MTTLRAWSDLSRAEAVEHLRPLLQARIAAGRQDSTSGRVIRRYTLSPAPLVRDARSGKTTGRLDDVLDGHLDQFFTVEEENAEEAAS